MSLLNTLFKLLWSGKAVAHQINEAMNLSRQLAEQVPSSSVFAVFCEVEIKLDGKPQRSWKKDPVASKVSYDSEQKGILYIENDQVTFMDVSAQTVFSISARDVNFTIKGSDVVLNHGTTQYTLDKLQSIRSLYMNTIPPSFAVDIDHKDRFGCGEIIDALKSAGALFIES